MDWHTLGTTLVGKRESSDPLPDSAGGPPGTVSAMSDVSEWEERQTVRRLRRDAFCLRGDESAEEVLKV